MTKIVEVTVNYEQYLSFYTEIDDDKDLDSLENDLHDMSLKWKKFENEAQPDTTILVHDPLGDNSAIPENCINIHEFFE